MRRVSRISTKATFPDQECPIQIMYSVQGRGHGTRPGEVSEIAIKSQQISVTIYAEFETSGWGTRVHGHKILVILEIFAPTEMILF